MNRWLLELCIKSFEIVDDCRYLALEKIEPGIGETAIKG